MKITDVESWMLVIPQNAEHRDFDDAKMELIGTTVMLDTGHQGIGYTWTVDFGGGEAIKALIDHVMIPRVIGRSAHEHKSIWKDLWWATNRMGSGVPNMAIAAIDIAIWDAMSRANDLPLAAMIGQVRDRVPTYSSGRASPNLTVEELVATAVDSVANGFDAVKLRVGKDPHLDIERLEAVREAVGPSVRLMCDANQRMDLATAQWLGQRMSPFDVFWYEEPVGHEQVQAHHHLRTVLPMSIAVGEHLFSLWDFVRYVEADAAGIFQPDVCMVGGVTEWLRIAELGLAHGIPIAPHFVPELHIHLAAATQNTIYVESFPMLDELITHQLEIENGQMLVPERPGHGLEFHDWVWERYKVL